MRNFSGWSHAAAALGLSLLMFSPAMAQNAAGEAAQAPDREARQNNPTESNPSNTNRSGARAGAPGQTGQPGAAARQGNTGRAAGQTGQQRTANRPVSGGEQSGDRQIAGLLAIGNAEEIALSRLAAQQAENEEVKKFAQMMIDEHSQVLQELTQIAPDAAQYASALDRGQEGAQASRQRSQGGERQAAGRQDSTQTGRQEGGATSRQQTTQTAATGGGLDMLAVHQQIAEKCLERARREMQDKQGAEFDMAYIGQQLVMHQQMIAKQEVLAQHASQELRQVIEKSQEGAEKHLEHAKQLVKQLSPQAAREVRENRTGEAGSDSTQPRSRDNAGSQQDRPTGSRPAAKAGNR